MNSNNLNLTNNEKKVFLAILSDPEASDTVLSKKIKMSRSSFSFLRRKIENNDLVHYSYVPSFFYLGCNLFTTVTGRFNIARFSLDEIKDQFNELEVTRLNMTEDSFFCLHFSKSLSDFESTLEINLRKLKKDGYLIEDPDIVHFHVKSMNYEVLDYFNLLFEHIDEKMDNYPLSKPESYIKLNKNVSKLILDLVEFPNSNITEIQNRTGISKPTIIKLKKKLIKNNLIKKMAIPNFINLNFCKYQTVVHFKFSPDYSLKTRKPLKRSYSEIFSFENNGNKVAILVFKNVEEEIKVINSMIKYYMGKEYINDNPTRIDISYHAVVYSKYDFISLTKELLMEYL